MQITPDFDRDTLQNRLRSTRDRADARTSRAREGRLRSQSQRRTREWDLTLDIDPEHQTAHVEMEGDDPHMVVTGREIDQPATDIDPMTWDYLAQRALAWHEAGHVLFTDSEDLERRRKDLMRSDRQVAQQVWNALEDGAIELALSERWSRSRPLLRALRANMFLAAEPGIDHPTANGRVFGLLHAVNAGLLDLWMAEVYDIHEGTVESLCDPKDTECRFASANDRELFRADALPLMTDVVDDVLTEPDPVARNERIFQFVEELLDLLDDAEKDGRGSANDDSEESPGGMPDDSEQETGEGEQADSLAGGSGGDSDESDDIEIDDIGDAVPAASDGDSAEEVEVPADIEQDAAEHVESEAMEEVGTSEDLLDEMDEISGMTAADDTVDRVEVPFGACDGSDERYAQARDDSREIVSLLERLLDDEQATQIDRNRRRGRYTGRAGAGVRASRGVKRVKERRRDPDTPERLFALVLDASGSMSGSDIRHAERAVGTVAIALEQVGIDTMVLRLVDGGAEIDLPFGASVETRSDYLFSGRTGGGTPLSDAVQIASDRLNRESDVMTAMVVTTDGQPSDEDEFGRAMDANRHPTLGIQIGGGSITAEDSYLSSVSAAGESLSDTLSDLIESVIYDSL